MVATLEKPRSGISVRATDVTGQRSVRLRDVTDQTIGELVDKLLPVMGLPAAVDGRALSYTARLEREGRHLHASERLDEVLQDEDEVVVSPNIDAG